MSSPAEDPVDFFVQNGEEAAGSVHQDDISLGGLGASDVSMDESVSSLGGDSMHHKFEETAENISYFELVSFGDAGSEISFC